jgi:plastocyanin
MRRITTLFFLLMGFATLGFSKDVFLTIGGTVGNGGVGSFRTDLRIFNPSSSKDIQIQAYFLPTGGGDNSGAQPKTITIPKRQMVLYDDAITALFADTRLGGIRLSSADDFVATQKIYSVAVDGTLGQFLSGVDSSASKKNGVLIQLKANGGSGQKGTFRTNLGMLNPNGTAANTTWRLYDKNNALVGTAKTLVLAPFAVVGPSEMRGFFGAAASDDLSDAWVGYTSDQPIVAYASCVDNGTTDPTYIAAFEDSSPPTTTPTTPQNKVLTVVEHNFSIVVGGAETLAVGDVVTVRVQVLDGPHGFELLDPTGIDVIPVHGATAPGTTYEETFTVKKTGTYSFFCTNSLCGAHTGMFGTFAIGDPGSDPGRPGY